MADEWIQTKLGDVCTFIGRKGHPGSLEAATPYVGLEHLVPEQARISQCATVDGVASQVALFEPGDVLFGRLRPYLKKVAIADFAGAGSTELLVLRATAGKVTPKYLYLLVSQASTIDHAVAMSAGSRMPRTSVADLGSAPVLLPPVDVQRRIVHLIGAFDDHLSSLVDELASLESLTLLMPSAGDGRRARPLGPRVRARGGKRMPKGVPFADATTDHAYLRVIDMVDGTFKRDGLQYVPDEVWPSISRYTVHTDDLIVSIVGTIGRVALVPGWADGANLTENAAVVDMHDAMLDKRWLAAWLRTPAGQSEIQRVTVGTSQGKLALTRIPLIEIPEMELSEQILRATAFWAAQEACSATRRQHASLALLKARLTAELLAGVREVPDSYEALLEAVA